MTTAVSGTIGCPVGNLRSLACALAANVSVVVTANPDGVTVVGLKEQVTPLGTPEQEKPTAELKPFSGVTVRVLVPWLAGAMESAAGDAPRVNVAAGRLMA